MGRRVSAGPFQRDRRRTTATRPQGTHESRQDHREQGRAALVLFADQRHGATKEPRHLITEPRPLAVYAAAAILHAELSHELVQRPAEHQLARLRPYRFGAHPRQEQTRQVAVRQSRVDPGGHGERVRPVVTDVPNLRAGVTARQTAQREQPSHETKVGVSLARADELRHLVELREVVARLWCEIAARWHLDTR